MSKRYWRFSALGFLLIGLVACSRLPDAGRSHLTASAKVSSAAATRETASAAELSQLFSRIWQVSKSPSQPASGSIYIFLANGTLLETSCVETYRIATWTIDQQAPRVLRVTEDKQLAFTATIAELTDTTLRLQKNLVRSKEKLDLTLTAVEQESVCPDMPK